VSRNQAAEQTATERRGKRICLGREDIIRDLVWCWISPGCGIYPLISVRMPTVHPELGAVQELLAAARQVLGIRVILRDFLDQAGLAADWRWRVGSACSAVKATDAGLAACRAYCGRQVVRDVALVSDGRIHTCPFGHTEIVVPVIDDGRSVGQLIAGPWWCGAGDPPRSGLVPADPSRLAAVHQVLIALAQRCAVLLAARSPAQGDRRQRILDLIARRHHEDLALREVAREVGLSTSRCGHIIQELFGRTYPTLLREARLNHAVRLLLGSDETVARIAAKVGFADASYFTRVFRAAYGCQPSTFRARPSQTSA
jgi:AraC-like DNA-binding protein